ncbi:MAG: extracellular solute-binding protein, partial [Lachnospiraceae bacterium]|nr:extracellular solute-binding protein [Lachnospiraceae bacterium]
MKKFLSVLLASAMVLSLAACGTKTTDATETKSESNTAATETVETASTDENSAYAQAIADRKAAAESSGSYEKVVISFFDWTGAPAGIDRINQKLSEYTEEKLGVDVELLIIDVAAYSDDIKLMLSSGEQVDLFSTCGPGYMTCVNNGYTADLEEDGLLETYAPGLKSVIRDDYFDACRVGGTLYGVPPIKDYA